MTSAHLWAAIALACALARNRIADAFDLLCEIAEPFDALLIRMWRWLTHTYAGGIILIGIAVMDIFTLLLLFWKP